VTKSTIPHVSDVVLREARDDENGRARRFYERRGWRANGTERIVPFGPNPVDVGYTRNIARRLSV
jgi:hypothetical protein